MSDDNNVEDWLQTFTGKKFRIFNPTEDMIDLEDIAHSLSNICRFNGHCNKFYSVAEHCVRLSLYVCKNYNEPRKALEALFHDAPEAYYCDIPRPFKYNLPLYREFERKVEKLIFDKFKLKYPIEEWLNELDTKMLKTEKQYLMSNSSEKWFCDNYEVLDINLDVKLTENVNINQGYKKLFIDLFNCLNYCIENNVVYDCNNSLYKHVIECLKLKELENEHR